MITRAHDRRKPAIKLNQELTIAIGQRDPAFDLAPQDQDLVAEQHNLGKQTSVRPERRNQNGQQEPEQRDHRLTIGDYISSDDGLGFFRRIEHQSERGAEQTERKRQQPQTKSTSQKVGKAATDVPAETLLGSDQATAKVLATDQPRNLKQNAVITLFNRPEGTTIDAIMKATGWQQHSVRGFFSGVVRKRLRLNLISEKTESGRIYRIASKPAAGKRKFRCATYTRKSSEEGLEQDFNSLQTQREACEAYITSKRHRLESSVRRKR